MNSFLGFVRKAMKEWALMNTEAVTVPALQYTSMADLASFYQQSMMSYLWDAEFLLPSTFSDNTVISAIERSKKHVPENAELRVAYEKADPAQPGHEMKVWVVCTRV